MQNIYFVYKIKTYIMLCILAFPVIKYEEKLKSINKNII